MTAHPDAPRSGGRRHQGASDPSPDGNGTFDADAVRLFLRPVVIDQAIPSLCKGSRIREGLKRRRFRADDRQ